MPTLELNGKLFAEQSGTGPVKLKIDELTESTANAGIRLAHPLKSSAGDDILNSDGIFKLKTTGSSIVASDGVTEVLSESSGIVTLNANNAVISGSSTGDLVRITQTGTGNALKVEDDTNPDSSPFVVDSSGNVGIGTTSPSSPSGTSLTVFDTSIPRINLKNSTTGDTSTVGGEIRQSGNQFLLTNRQNSDLIFGTNNIEKMRIDSSGNVGIGTTSPNSPLDIAGNDGVTVRRVGQTNGFLIRPISGSGDGVRFTQEGTGDRMTIDGSGNIGAPSGTNIYNASDERLKQNITELSGCLQKVLSMRGVSFNWIDDFCDSEADKILYGLIAQELQAVDSNLVDSFSDNTITAGSVTVENPLRVNEKFIIPMLVESIKEQQALIESQQTQIDALTARIEALESN